MQLNLIKVATVRGIRREVRKRVPPQNGGRGFTTVADGYEIADIEVHLDASALASLLGPKAMGSKSRKSKLQTGAITIKAVNVRREGGAA